MLKETNSFELEGNVLGTTGLPPTLPAFLDVTISQKDCSDIKEEVAKYKELAEEQEMMLRISIVP